MIHDAHLLCKCSLQCSLWNRLHDKYDYVISKANNTHQWFTIVAVKHMWQKVMVHGTNKRLKTVKNLFTTDEIKIDKNIL